MHFLITAGPTREYLDPVRYLSNRSSGKMGYALAQAAKEAGHHVTLISGPVSLRVPAGVRLLEVQSAKEMYDAVAAEITGAAVSIFSAAVADYRPVQRNPHKIKKSGAHLTLELERTPDILAAARSEFGFRGVLIGFAAETENMLVNAQEKLRRKHCDVIVANDVGRPGIGFDSDDNEVTLILANGRAESWPKMSKLELAQKLIGVAVDLVKG